MWLEVVRVLADRGESSLLVLSVALLAWMRWRDAQRIDRIERKQRELLEAQLHVIGAFLNGPLFSFQEGEGALEIAKRQQEQIDALRHAISILSGRGAE